MKEILDFILAKTPKIYEGILRLKGKYNLEKILFLNLVKNGDLVFDIGANVGYYTLIFSHLVGAKGEVHAFEPLPPTFEQLSQVIETKRRYNNVHLNHTAVSDNNGSITMYMPDSDHGQASIKTHNDGSWKNARTIKSYECKVLKMDDYVDSLHINRLSFIKLDIEGAELLALRGLTETISRFLPMIYLEVCEKWIDDFGYRPMDIVNFLASFGYSHFYLVSNKIELFQKENIESLEKSLSFSANLLCTIPELHGSKTKYLAIEYLA